MHILAMLIVLAFLGSFFDKVVFNRLFPEKRDRRECDCGCDCHEDD